MNRAFIFPGQGSQTIGMGKDFYDNFLAAKETFDEVDNCLNRFLSKIIFSGDIAELTLTHNAQPALACVSIAILRVLIHEANLHIENLCKFTAGHSLGEYSALYANGTLNLPSTMQLLETRGQAMQEVANKTKGAMAACLNINIKELQNLINDNVTDGICQIANDNSANQIVIAGNEDNIDRVIEVLKDKNYKAIKLNVAGAFHCDVMKPVELIMHKALAKINFNKPIVPIISNVSAKPQDQPHIIKDNLIKQICSPVRMRETFEFFDQTNINHVIEIGAGSVLTNLAKRGPYNFTAININTISDLKDYLSIIA